MTRRISEREWQELSTYLDDQLSRKEKNRVDEKLRASLELQAALDDLKRLRALLRSQPRLRAPRNFTLSPETAGIKPSRRATARRFPVFGLVSALASVLLVLVIAGELLLSGPQMAALPVSLESQPEAIVVEESLEEMPVESEALPLAQEAGESSSKVLEFQATTEAGVRSYPPPDSSEEGGMAAEAAETSPMTYPSPAPTYAESLDAEAVSMASEKPSPGEQEVDEGQLPASLAFWNGWRVAQAVLLVVVLVSALLAFSLRQGVNK